MTRGQTKCLTVGLRVDSASEGSPSGTKLLSARAVGLMKQYARRPSLQASSAWRRETGVVNSHFYNCSAARSQACFSEATFSCEITILLR